MLVQIKNTCWRKVDKSDCAIQSNLRPKIREQRCMLFICAIVSTISLVYVTVQTIFYQVLRGIICTPKELLILIYFLIIIFLIIICFLHIISYRQINIVKWNHVIFFIFCLWFLFSNIGLFNFSLESYLGSMILFSIFSNKFAQKIDPIISNDMLVL